MTISVIDNPDGTFTIDWDHTNPKESILNNWTEEDFIHHFRSYCENIIAKSNDPDNEQICIEEAVEAFINEADRKDWEE